MRQLNSPTNRSYFTGRIVFLIAFVAALTFLVTRNDFTSRASSFALQGGCATDPVVINNLDSGAGSLRQAIADACADSTITFNMATVTSPITLTTAELLINKNLTITGPGASTLTIERSAAPATPQFRIFNVTFGTVSISGLTVTNGRAADGVLSGNIGLPGGGGGAIRTSATSLTLSDVHITNNRAGNGANAPTLPGDGGRGGAIFNENGLLTMTNCTITGNSGGNGGFSGNNLGGGRGGEGGGIYTQNGTLNLTNVAITNNTGGNSTENGSFGGIGGGIYTNTTTVATLTNCTVSGNTAGEASGIDSTDGFAGGINADGPMTIIGSTISGNTSREAGGGFLSRTSLTLINSTISGNTGGNGGAINNDIPSNLSLTNCTITNNSATQFGAGIVNHNPNARVRNTIIAANVGLDATGNFISLGNNIIGNGNNVSTSGFVNGVNGDKVGTQESPVNPGLAPLANNGGPTQTHALLATSPALDAGNNCVVDNSCSPALGVSLTTDQRGAGFPRARDAADSDTTQTVDIGAFESQASVENITDKSTPEDTLLSFSFNVGDASAITNVSASSANTVLVPNANLSVIGSGSTRTLNITPATNLSGTTTTTVTVTSGAESMSDTFVLTVTPANDAPTDIALPNNNVADNSPSNTLVGTFASVDIDPLQTFTYSLVSGAGGLDNASFSIAGDQLRTASTIDFETKPIFSIRVRSTDGGGLFVEKQFFINVIDGADNPGVISFTSGDFNVGEGAGNANITLTRTGGTDNRVVAKVNLADVTTSPADYVFAPGSLDPTFNTGTGATSSTNGSLQQFVDTVVLQPDGKILIGGAFLFYNDVTRNRVARINADGTLDTSFNPGGGANNNVLCMALQPDGKILIGGSFNSYDGTPRTHIARLNSNGTLDLSFAALVPNDVVRSIVVQPDGKILIGGDFTAVNGFNRNHIARLNDDGSLDFSFNAASGGNGVVGTLTLQPDGKIIVAGGFLSFAGADNTRIVRLTGSGALDATFNSALGTSLAPHQVVLQPDGKILVAGEFIGVDTPFGRQGIARLETSGAADPTFNPGLGTEGQTVDAMALQPDSKIVIVGGFPTFNGTTVNRIARLNSGGSVDSSFNSGEGLNSLGFSVVVQPDGKIVIGGLHTFYNGVSNNGITRINGDLFATWEAGDSANKSVSLPIVDDTLDEPNETLSLQVVPVSGGATAGVPSQATLTILDNDPSPTAISGVSGAGTFGGTATLTATLSSGGSGLSGKTVSFTLNGSAVGNATTNASGVATLSGVSLAGINAGSHPAAVGASFAAEAGNFLGSSGTGPLTVSQATTAIVVSSSVNPSEFGQSVTFTATVTGPGGTPTGTVQFKDGGSNLGSAQTLTAGVAQLTTSSLASGTHTITAEYSGDANFQVSSGTLVGGQVVKPQPTLLINDVSVAEGDGGTRNLVFTVSLSATSSLAVNVSFATADGTATTSDSDYQSANGIVFFNPGDLTTTITLQINGDQKFELDETVFVNLTNPVNAAIADAQGVGTIDNDDNLQLILDESGPAVDQAAALESMFLLRDPFKVLSIAEWMDLGADRNTRVIIFAANLQGNLAVVPSVTVSLVDANNQTHDVPAEDVRVATHPDFSQVVFRLPNGLAPGVCHVTIKSQGRTSNTGTIRIAAP